MPLDPNLYAQPGPPGLAAAPINLPVQQMGPINLPVQQMGPINLPPVQVQGPYLGPTPMAQAAQAGGVDPSWLQPPVPKEPKARRDESVDGPMPEAPTHWGHGSIPTMAEDNGGSGKGAGASSRRQDLIFNQPVPGQHDVTDDSGEPVTTTIPAHTEITVDPEEREGLKEANATSVEGVKGQRMAEEELGAAAADKARIEAKGAEDVGAGIGKEASSVEKEAADRKLFADDMREKSAQAHYHAYQLGISMDPNRYFKNLGTWDRIRLALTSFLGGAAQGLHATRENVGLEEIHRGIDEDIANQRAQVEAAGSFAKNIDGLYAQAYAQTGDHLQATILAKSLATKMVAQQALAAAIRAGSPIEIAKAKEVSRRLEEHEGELLRQGRLDQIATSKRVPAQTVTTGGASGPGLGDVDWKAQEQISKDLREAKIPQAEEAIEQAQSGIANGNYAGISTARQALPGGEGNAARAWGGPGVSSNLQNLDQLAYAVATTTGRGQVPDKEKVELIKNFIRGDGSEAAYDHGLRWAQKTVQDEKANIKSGHHPTQVLVHDVLEALQRKRAALQNYKAVGGTPGLTLDAAGGDAKGRGVQAPPELTPDEQRFLDSFNPETSGKSKGAGGGKGSKDIRPHFEKPIAPMKSERR